MPRPSAASRLGNRSERGWRTLAICLILVGFVPSALGIGSIPGVPREAGVRSVGSLGPVLAGPTGEVPSGCSSLALTRVIIAPGNLSIKGESTQVFTATALDSCGASVTNNSNFSWSLDPSALGTLSPDGRDAVAYSACIAPMGGTLRVSATDGAVMVTTNASVAVWFDLGSSANSTLRSPDRLNGIVLASLLVGAGGVLAVWTGAATRRPPRSKVSTLPGTEARVRPDTSPDPSPRS